MGITFTFTVEITFTFTVEITFTFTVEITFTLPLRTIKKTKYANSILNQGCPLTYYFNFLSRKILYLDFKARNNFIYDTNMFQRIIKFPVFLLKLIS